MKMFPAKSFITPIRCAKSVQICNFSGPYFPELGLNTEIYSVKFRTQFKYGKIRTRKNPNLETFYVTIPTQFEDIQLAESP